MSLASGSRLGSYEIVASLGAGGMGEVYRAHDSRLGRDVALKVLPPDVTDDPSRLERFDREARAIAALNHPHIVTIYSTEEIDGVRFLTMELVEGQTLTELITASGLPIARFLEIAIPLADALSAAHQKQITHRDLKPGNVMVSREGRVKVLDFGLARIGGSEIGEHSIAATRAPVTQAGMIVGTMSYMSPEQVEGRPLDPRSDLFSLGVIFYELLNGDRPFKGESSPAVMSAILRDTPASLLDTRSDVPEPLARVIARCLEKRPEDRVQTARDVYNELRHVQKQLESGTRSSTPSTGLRTGSTRALATPSENLCIAVLPFTVRGADGDSEALALGLTEDVTTSLARFSYLRVISRTAADRAAPVLPARYVVEGHVRRADAVVRVSVKLTDTVSGTHLWAENYNRPASADPFALQDDISSRIAATVADASGVLLRAMAATLREKPLGDFSVFELVVRFHAYLEHFDPAEHAQLRDRLVGALEKEPGHADAWGCLSSLIEHEHSHGLNPLPDSLARARQAAERSIAANPVCQEGWRALASASFFARDREGVRVAAERAIALNPLNTGTVAACGMFMAYSGAWDRGLEVIEQAMQPNPHYPGWLHFVPFSYHYNRQEYREALQHAKHVNMPLFPKLHLSIAAAAGELGLREEARAALDALSRIDPDSLDLDHARSLFAAWLWTDEELDRITDGVRKAKALAAGGITAPDQPSRSTARSSAVMSSATRPPSSSGIHAAAAPSIAVMPFTDLSATKDQDWFCDGIAEEILNALSPLPGLHVAARASAFSLRGKTDDLRLIGEKLNVKTVLEGSVRRVGDRVRITTQLSDVEQGRQLWSERFDRELKDIFDVQDEIARAIVERLKVTLVDGGRERLVPRATTNIDAYELLLKGRVLLTRRGRAIVDAMQYFEQAVALDPNLSEAHALLGDAHRLTALYGLVPANDAMPRARASAERALALDPNQVEALATLANIASTYDWDTTRSMALSDRALAVDPSHVRTLAERAISLVVTDHLPHLMQQSILADVRRARTLDPLNAWAASVESMCLACLGQLQEAIAVAERAVAMDENNFTAHWTMVITLAWAGRDEEAQRAAVPALAMSGRHPRILAELAAIHAAHGDEDAAEAIHLELRDRARTGHIGFAEQAAVAASAGHVEEARRLVAAAIAARDPYLRFWKFPAGRPLWNDPESAAILRNSDLFRG